VPGWPSIADAGRRTLDRNSASGTGRSGGWCTAPRGAVSRVRGSRNRRSRAAFARDRRVVADREAGDQRLERAFKRQVLALRPALEADLLDLLAFGDDV